MRCSPPAIKNRPAESDRRGHRDGAGITLLEALKAYDVLLKEGIHIRVIDLYSCSPSIATAHRRGSRHQRTPDHG